MAKGVFSFPEKKYDVIVIDPPWQYTNKRIDDKTQKGVVPYQDMTIDEIAAMPIPMLAAADCILWLWTTNAFIHEAYHLIEGWGFTQKTVLTWGKSQMGLGRWLRGKTEHCIMSVLGKPIVNLTNQTTFLYGRSREHSRKPEKFYELVQKLCPGRKIELFARQERIGWDFFGDETSKFRKEAKKWKFV